MKRLITILALVLASGCASLVPSERAQSAAVKATEALATQQSLTIRRALDSGMERSLAVASNAPVTSAPLHEQLEITSTTTTDAGSRSSDIGSSIVTIPLFVKLIGLAIGTLFLIIVIWLLRRSSVAVNAAWGAGDTALATLTDRIASIASQASDPAHKSNLNDLLATAQKERGKLNAS